MMAVTLRIVKIVLIVFINLLAMFSTITPNLQAMVSIPIGGEIRDIEILPSGEKAYLANTSNNTVVVIDTDPLSPSFNTVIATVPVGIRPSGIAITPDGARVYVTNQGATITDVDSISVISTASDTVIVTSDLGSLTAPGGIAITPDGTRAYFTTFEGKLRILDTDPSSLLYNLPIDSIDIPLLSYGNVAITPDGAKAVVNWAGGIAHAVDVIDVEPGSPTYHTIIGSPVPVVQGSAGDIAVSTDNAFAYATGTTSLCRVCKIDLQTFDVDINFEDISAHQWYVALTPDGSNLYTASPNSTELSIFDTADLSLLVVLELGGPLGGIAITPDGSRAYVVRDPISFNSEVVVLSLPPVVASFSASPESGTAPLNVNFTDQSFGATSWFWDFGDGADSAEQSPSHTYTSAGTYTVRLTVTGPGGSDTETKTNFIVVSQPSPPPPQPCQPNQGTIGTEFTISGQDFGENKGKVLIGSGKCQVLEWTNTSIRCLIKKVPSTMPPGIYNVTVQPKDKGMQPAVMENAFTIMAPKIDDITPDNGVANDEITITGGFFGTKKVKASMGDGVGKTKKGKVVSLTMDSGTGASTLVILVPKKLAPGLYNVTVTNKVGEDTLVGGFTIQ